MCFRLRHFLNVELERITQKKSKSIGSDEKETEPDPNNEVNKHVSLKMKVGNKRYTGK